MHGYEWLASLNSLEEVISVVLDKRFFVFFLFVKRNFLGMLDATASDKTGGRWDNSSCIASSDQAEKHAITKGCFFFLLSLLSSDCIMYILSMNYSSELT